MIDVYSSTIEESERCTVHENLAEPDWYSSTIEESEREIIEKFWAARPGYSSTIEESELVRRLNPKCGFVRIHRP